MEMHEWHNSGVLPCWPVSDRQDSPATWPAHSGSPETRQRALVTLNKIKKVFGIRDVLKWMRLLGSVPLDYGSRSGFGSCSFL
jgi:hypothetical protein